MSTWFTCLVKWSLAPVTVYSAAGAEYFLCFGKRAFVATHLAPLVLKRFFSFLPSVVSLLGHRGWPVLTLSSPSVCFPLVFIKNKPVTSREHSLFSRPAYRCLSALSLLLEMHEKSVFVFVLRLVLLDGLS